MVAPARGPPRVHRGSRGGPPGGQDRGCDPNHRLRHPPRWCGSQATQRNHPTCRSVTPKRPRSGPAGRNRGIFPRSAGAPPKRRDGATSRGISRRRSTPTPPGGVTQPVVGVATAVLAPRRPPPGPAVDPPRGRPGGATSVSCTSFYHTHLTTHLTLWPILRGRHSPLSVGWSGPRPDTISPQSSLCL